MKKSIYKNKTITSRCGGPTLDTGDTYDSGESRQSLWPCGFHAHYQTGKPTESVGRMVPTLDWRQENTRYET